MSLLLSCDLPIERIREEAGSKAAALARMEQEGFSIPKTAFVPSRIYRNYLDSTSLRGSIIMELGRKSFEDMRWEEMWDAALRIRNLFLNNPLPANIAGLYPVLV